MRRQHFLLLFFLLGYGCLGELYDWSIDPDEFFDGMPDTSMEHGSPRRDGSRSTGQPGNFGSGVLMHSIGSGDEAARGAVIQTDGKIVVGGRIHNGTNNDFLIVRFNVDGSIDTSFFSTGSARVSFGGGDDLAHGVELQTNGKILIAGRSDLGGSSFDFAIARLNADGSLDTTFNSNGKKTVDLQGSIDIARAIAIDESSNFAVIAGYSYNATKFDAGVIRLTSDGQLDTAFNSSGKKVIAISANDNGALGVALLTSAIAIAGPSYNGSDWDFGVVRLASSGLMDTTFHSDGRLTTTIGTANDRAFGAIIDTSNRVLVVGQAFISGQGEGTDTKNQFVIARYLSTGALDTSFDSNGLAIEGFGDFTSNQAGYAIRLLSDGKVIAAGIDISGSNDFRMGRWGTDGSLDGAFNGGSRRTDFGEGDVGASGQDIPQAIAMRGDGYVIAAGRTNLNGNWDIGIIRYNTDGTLAPAGGLYKYWGAGGYKTVDVAPGDLSKILDLKVQTDGKLVAVGSNGASNSHGYVVRYNLDGSLDTTFNSSGTNTTQINFTDSKRSLFIDSSGRIFTGGVADMSSNHLVIVRFRTDGVFDTSFHTDGAANISGSISSSANYTPIIGGTVGPVIAADGSTEPGSMTSGSNLARFITDNWAALPDGALDTTFDRGGLTQGFGTGYTVGKRIIYNGNSNYYVPGTVISGSAIRHALIRYNLQGVLDTSFNGGLSVYHFDNTDANYTYAVKLTASGYDSNVLAVGAYSAGGAALFRVDFSGNLDTAFNSTGYVIKAQATLRDIYDVSFTAENRFVTVGSNLFFEMARWTSDGNFDTTFNSTGTVTDTAFGAQKFESLAITNEGLLCGGGQGTGNAADFMIICRWQ